MFKLLVMLCYAMIFIGKLIEQYSKRMKIGQLLLPFQLKCCEF